MRKLHLVAGLALALSLAACGGDGTGPGDGNGDGNGNGNGDGNGNGSGTSFSAEVTGGYEREVSGIAYFGDSEELTGTGFGLGLGTLDTDSPVSIVFHREQEGRLAPGTYAIVDIMAGEEPTSTSIYSGASIKDGESKACLGTGGELVITSSSSEELKGNFEVTYSCFDFTNQTGEPVYDVTISGEFDAEKAVVPMPN